MAFPPRFGMHQLTANSFMPAYGAVPMVSMVPATHYIVPTMPGGVITSAGPRNPMRRKEPPYEKPPVTTVFVGNIHERASNELIKSLLQKCGNIIQWKRIQGPNGKFQAFGFCEFDHPDSTLRAARLLNDFSLGEKRLVVKCDEKTRELLKEYVNKRRQQIGKGPLQLETDQLPCDDNMKREDPSYQKALFQIVQELGGPELATTGSVNEKASSVRVKSPTLSGKGGNLDIESLDREKKEYIAREINLFRLQHKDDKDVKSNKNHRGGSRSRHDRQDRSRSPKSREGSSAPVVVDREDDRRPSRKRERATPPDSPRSSHSRNSSLMARQVVNKKSSGKVRKRESSRESGRSSRNRRNSRSRSRVRDSEDEEEAYERKRLERKIREKDAAYQERLKKWEGRERKKIKEYEKEKLKQKEKRREELREGKKLKEFFEDYDDERDDVKYYKGKSYEFRRREFERERETDGKDRQKEKEELDEIKKKLLEDGITDPEEEINKMQREQEEKLLKRLRADSSESPSPVRPQKVDITSSETNTPATKSSPSDDESESKSNLADMDAKDDKSWHSVGVEQAKPSLKGLGFAGLKLASSSGGGGGGQSSAQGPVKNALVDQTMNDDDDNLHGASTSRKRLVPLEYSEEENQVLLFDPQAQQLASMSAEDKRKAIKTLIEKIPTSKDELFAYAISWSHVDTILVEKRLKPWINKKIVEYIGEEEPTLVEFICQKIAQKSTPTSILEDISMVLDEEASVFVVKLWRLLIYEIEAKRFGLVKVETPA